MLKKFNVLNLPCYLYLPLSAGSLSNQTLLPSSNCYQLPVGPRNPDLRLECGITPTTTPV